MLDKSDIGLTISFTILLVHTKIFSNFQDISKFPFSEC